MNLVISSETQATKLLSEYFAVVIFFSLFKIHVYFLGFGLKK